MNKSCPICYVEIGTTDVSRSATFYRDLFGWPFGDMNSKIYTTFSSGDGIGGGLYHIDQIKPGGGIIMYIAVEDITATLTKIVAAGGTILVPKSDITGTGWYGHFVDPVGNHFGLYTPQIR